MSSTPPNSIPPPLPPPRVPDHELIRRIGRGAYGEVWIARSVTGAFRAVKIVHRQSFDHDRPFEREFEGILKFEPISRRHDSQVDILHVGRGDDCFYYVMELADDQATGGQINPDNYTPRTLKSDLLFHGRLPFEECVRIGLALATALENLHGNGLAHRDVKPSNIIFVNGVPKLADIGLVAGVEATRSYVGTEGFAAPEGPGSPQADLYSLGKVLYEISMGKDRQEFPELPTKLRELPDRDGLMELNAVIARACRHDPKDRYASATAMRADLELLQSGKSLARLHRAEKRLQFVTRFAVAVVAVLLLGVVPYYWAINSARRASQSAKKATTEAGKSREVADFLKQMFESVRQSATMGQDTAMVKGILQQTRARVGQDLKDQPEVQADLLTTIGNISFDLGEGAEAIEVLREALRLRRSIFGETNLLVAESLFWFALSLEMQGEGRNARLAAGQALEIRRKLLGEDHPDTARALSAYGTIIRNRPDEAEAAHREALRLLQKHYPEGSVHVAEALDNLGLTLKIRDKLTEGEQIARQSLDMWRKLTGAENADVATAWTRLGVIVQLQEKFEAAEPLLREGYRQRRKFLGADHPYACSALGSLATVLNFQGKFAEAEQLIRDHLSMCKKKEGNLITPALLQNLAISLFGQGRFTEAQATYRDKAELETRQMAEAARWQAKLDEYNRVAVDQTNLFEK